MELLYYYIRKVAELAGWKVANCAQRAETQLLGFTLFFQNNKMHKIHNTQTQIKRKNKVKPSAIFSARRSALSTFQPASHAYFQLSSFSDTATIWRINDVKQNATKRPLWSHLLALGAVL